MRKIKLALLFIVLMMILLKVIPVILGIVFSFMWFCFVFGICAVIALTIIFYYEIKQILRSKSER